MLYQLFYNLVNNALKFSRTDVAPLISVAATTASAADLQRAHLEQGKKYIKITVQDNGIGFNQQNAEKIFQTFSRLHSKDKYEGTGLGLALCRKIVERHKGYIFAEGKEGEGAAFHILLPQ